MSLLVIEYLSEYGSTLGWTIEMFLISPLSSKVLYIPKEIIDGIVYIDISV